MTTPFSILHNPRCSKSRQTLALLQENSIEPTVIEYLKTPLDKTALHDIFSQLGLDSVIGMMRTKEAEFKELSLNDATLSNDALIDALVSHPKLIERPIVFNGDIAVIGRPPENVLSLIK